MSDNDDKDPPIVAQEFLHGVKVVDFGDLRVSRGFSRRPFSLCHHRNMVYDDAERRVWCNDCEKNIEPYDAFTSVVKNYNAAYKHLETLRLEAVEAREHSLFLLACKKIEKVWRGRKLAPACPHCKRGLLPGDFSDNFTKTSSKLEIAMRKKQQK